MKLASLFWVCIIIPVLLFVLLMFSAANAWFGFNELPKVDDLVNPKSNLATEVYTADGKVLGRYFYQNRVNVDYDDISPFLVDAFVSTEDERYYQHSGIDLKSLARALFYMGKKGGASTITQQLSKMLFSEKSPNLISRVGKKLQEWIISAQLEQLYLSLIHI